MSRGGSLVGGQHRDKGEMSWQYKTHSMICILGRHSRLVGGRHSGRKRLCDCFSVLRFSLILTTLIELRTELACIVLSVVTPSMTH
jgi:hypothetical protein